MRKIWKFYIPRNLLVLELHTQFLKKAALY